jgi:hypothetical protein
VLRQAARLIDSALEELDLLADVDEPLVREVLEDQS